MPTESLFSETAYNALMTIKVIVGHHLSSQYVFRYILMVPKYPEP